MTGEAGEPEIIFTPEVVIKFLVFNEPFFISGHLWFLFSLLYAYVCMYICRDKLAILNNRKLFILMSALFYVVYFVLSYGFYSMRIEIPNCVYRNFLFGGISLMLLGYLFHRNQKKIIRRVQPCWMYILIVSGR